MYSWSLMLNIENLEHKFIVKVWLGGRNPLRQASLTRTGDVTHVSQSKKIRQIDTTKQLKQFSMDVVWVSPKLNSILQLPGGSVRLHKVRAQTHNTASSSDVNLKSRLFLIYIGYKLEVPTSCWIKLLEWLTELRKLVLLTRWSVYCKGYEWRAGWNDA